MFTISLYCVFFISVVNLCILNIHLCTFLKMYDIAVRIPAPCATRLGFTVQQAALGCIVKALRMLTHTTDTLVDTIRPGNAYYLIRYYQEFD